MTVSARGADIAQETTTPSGVWAGLSGVEGTTPMMATLVHGALGALVFGLVLVLALIRFRGGEQVASTDNGLD